MLVQHSLAQLNLTLSECYHRMSKPCGGQDGLTKHQSIVIATDKILSVFARILLLLKGTIIFPSVLLFELDIPKILILPFTLRQNTFLPSPLCLNTYLAIPAKPKCFPWHPSYTRTLFLPSPLRPNTYLIITATPKHCSCHSRCTSTLFCHSRYTKTLYLVTTWQHMVTPGNS